MKKLLCIGLSVAGLSLFASCDNAPMTGGHGKNSGEKPPFTEIGGETAPKIPADTNSAGNAVTGSDTTANTVGH